MPPILPIHKQGFPGLLNDLGVIGPLQGPFWGFEPTVMPAWIVGNQAPSQNAGQPYFQNDISTISNNDPATGTVMGQSPQLRSGRYGVEIIYTYFNVLAVTSELQFLVIDALGGTLRSMWFEHIDQGGTARGSGSGQVFFVEDLNNLDKVAVLNDGATLTGGRIRVTLKWIRLNSLIFKE